MIRRVRKIVQTSVSARGEKRLKTSGSPDICNEEKGLNPLIPTCFSEGSGIGSLHWTAILESSCKMILTGRGKWPRKPRGSYRELTVE